MLLPECELPMVTEVWEKDICQPGGSPVAPIDMVSMPLPRLVI